MAVYRNLRVEFMMAMIMGMVLVMGELGAAADAQSPSPNPQAGGAAAIAVSSLSSFLIASLAAILLCGY
ncbi:hypothetical protein SUGI_0443310 [Cryptomeria japonica]|nr:hypothetical protein SUGI_0443310 [Cryptomeria japonica]